jgi:hypothetical protein
MLSFPCGHPVAAYAFFLIFTSPLSSLLFPSVTWFSKGTFYASCDQSNRPSSIFVACSIFLSFFPLTNTFLTRLGQLVSILLQHHILKISRFFLPTFRSVQFPAPHEINVSLQNVQCRSKGFVYVVSEHRHQTYAQQFPARSEPAQLCWHTHFSRTMAFKDRKLVISSCIRPPSTTTSPVTAQNAPLTISRAVAKRYDHQVTERYNS